MATIHSLGLHEPSALSYFVNEGLLPPGSPPSAYHWDYQHTLDETLHTTEEILRIDDCVVWSCNGTIKRVFNLDIEGETITHAFTTSFAKSSSHRNQSDGSDREFSTTEKALVVILKTQAHIFLLSGDMHVVPLSFEVEKAIPAAFGFLLQRAILTTAQENLVPSHNALSSNQPLGLSPAQNQDRPSISIHLNAGRERSSQLPRTFAFPELLSELNLVVSGSLRKHEPTEYSPILSYSEEIIYVSRNDELHELYIANSEHIYLALTVDSKAGTLTVWQVLFKSSDTSSTSRAKPADKVSRTSKRKSSNVYGRQTGAATPNVRVPGTFRESMGGLPQSIPESSMFPSSTQTGLPGDLAVQLGHEFEQVGVQTRSARRVSSMLARTDLGGTNDRSAFNDMALGTIGRKSFGRSTKRGESLGGFSDRQSFGTRRRSSFQAASSMYSNGTSFLDIPASHLLDDGIGPSDIDAVNAEINPSVTSRLPRNVAFMKLKSLPYQVTNDAQIEYQPIKVTTMLAPDRSTADDRRNRIISVCIMDRDRQEMTIVNIAAKVSLPASRHKADKVTYELKAVEVQRGQSIVDACPVIEDKTKRLLILTQTREGRSVLHLEAPWSASYRVNLPDQFRVFDTSSTTRGSSPASRRDTGIRRIIPHSEIDIKGLGSCEMRDQVLAFDSESRCHRLRFKIIPTQPLVRKIIDMCNFVLAPEFFESILVAWWEVKRWIEIQGYETNVEWTAMTVTLFVLAVPFISNLQNRPAPGPPRKKGGVLRSSSGTTLDLANWDLMQELEAVSTLRTGGDAASWAWTKTSNQPRLEPKSPSKHSRAASRDVNEDSKDAFLIRCVNLARDFLQSPAGENATGPEGYLAIAINKERTIRRTALASILIGLHLLREEFKLHEIATSTPSEVTDDLAAIIIQIASWVRWKDWTARPGHYYHTEVNNPARWLMETSVIDGLEVPPQPYEPPSIYEHVENAVLSKDIDRFPSILDLVSQTRAIAQNHPLWKEAARITPRLFAVSIFVAQLKQKKNSRSILKHMLNCGIDNEILDTIPAGIAAVCHQAIVTVRGQPPADWSLETRSILGRADLDVDQGSGNPKSGLHHISHVHDALRDYRTISNSALDAETVSRWDAFSEVDRQAITRLIFSEDRRFQEASKLVNQTRPPIVECSPEPGWSEADLLDAQKELAIHVTRRTLSVAAGRAMMHFNARVPLLTERVPIPAFNLQCLMKARGVGDNSQPMTLSADKALFTEDKVCWAFFHNGASAGLMISRDTRWIDTSWILYNKPPELTNRHAGFLLALGLNGHLRSLAKWVAFKYLTPKHTMTSVGLLLGLAASYLGTMDTLVARLLSVHVTRLLPVGAAELNLSPLTQTTGIIGVGLLYFNSQHRRMSEIMLSEIENNDSEERSGDEPILRDEGYRLAAGFALGLINLGHGKTLHSLHDMGVVERLLTIAVGTKNVNHVHVLDRATAGAVLAVAFLFMKTNDQTIARKIDIPDTPHQFDYVRPDIFLLRTLARHLIMWDSIVPSHAFVRASLPAVFSLRADLTTTKRLSTDDLPFFNALAGICFAISLRFAGSHRQDVRDLLVKYLDQFLRLSKLPALNYDAKVTLNGLRNCLDVLALSCATVMSGSGDLAVMRRLRGLHGRTDKDTPFGSHLAAHMALGVLFLSGGTATFGTSNFAIAALVISLYPLFPVDVLDNKGHLQALRHLWVLAVENRCLVARDVETQQVISEIEAEVEFIEGTKRKFQTPCLLPEFEQIRRVSFVHENYWPVQIDFESAANVSLSVPSYRNPSKKLPQTTRERLKLEDKGLRLFLQQRTAYEKPGTDTFFSELQALDEARGVPSIDSNAGVNEKWRQLHGHGGTSDKIKSQDPFDWVFGVGALKYLDFAEKALVLDDTGLDDGNARTMLKETAVDSWLEFEFGCLGVEDDGREAKALSKTTLSKDKLWQLRLLFHWADIWEKEDVATDRDVSGSIHVARNARWLKKEVIEQLKWRLWSMAEREKV